MSAEFSIEPSYAEKKRAQIREAAGDHRHRRGLSVNYG